MNLIWAERTCIGSDISIEKFKKFGDLISYEFTNSENIAERIKDAEIVICNKVQMNEGTLKDAHKLKLICEAATGFDNIDIAYCQSRGITVTNVPAYSTESVVQHTFALYFYLLENLRFYDYFVKSGKYANQPNFTILDQPFSEVSGQTWGIIGLGNIGKRVAQVATAFGAKVITYSVSGKNQDNTYTRVSFDELLAQSDVISLHCPLNEKTKYLFGETAFDKMKKSAILLNLARGAVVEQEALYDALVNDQIAAAGLDVLEHEPIRNSNPLSQIADSGKLIITPHIAWTSVQARIRCVDIIYNNILGYLNGNIKNAVT